MNNFAIRCKEKYSVNNKSYRVVWCPIFKVARIVSTICWLLTWLFLILGAIAICESNIIFIAIDAILLVITLFCRFQNWKKFI